MATDVIVLGAGASTVRMPFATASIAAAAQAAADNANALYGLGSPFYETFVPPDISGAVTAPNTARIAAAVIDTVPAALAFGILPSKYVLFANAGDGLAAVIGAPNTTLIAGPGATTLYVNQNAEGQVSWPAGQATSATPTRWRR